MTGPATEEPPVQPPSRTLSLLLGAIVLAAGVIAVSQGAPTSVELSPATVGADTLDDSDGRGRDDRSPDDDVTPHDARSPDDRPSPDDGPSPSGLVTPSPAPVTEDRAASTFDAAGAGTVTYEIRAGEFVLIAATPASGWVVDVEVAQGIELDLDFRSGTRRVQVDVEFEDGGVRERVRLRDDAGADDDAADDVTSGDDDGDDDRAGSDDDDDDDDDRDDD